MAKTKQQIRVLLADDHAIFRDGLRKLLDADEDITIVGEAQNGAECIKLLAKLKPDILLLDLRMPDKDGLAVLEEVNFDTLPTRVVEIVRIRTAPRKAFAQRPRKRNRPACRPGFPQQGNRRKTFHLRTNRQKPSAQHLRQARRLRPPRTRALCDSPPID